MRLLISCCKQTQSSAKWRLRSDVSKLSRLGKIKPKGECCNPDGAEQILKLSAVADAASLEQHLHLTPNNCCEEVSEAGSFLRRKKWCRGFLWGLTFLVFRLCVVVIESVLIVFELGFLRSTFYCFFSGSGLYTVKSIAIKHMVEISYCITSCCGHAFSD